MSRAWLSLLRGDFAAAAFYHPLFWLPPLAVLAWLLRGLLPRKLAACLAWTACALFLAVYAWRMADPEDSIVVFHPESGLLFRSWRTVLRFLKNKTGMDGGAGIQKAARLLCSGASVLRERRL